MKTLIFALIIISFIQSTVLPIDLVLIILICRSYIKSDRANLFLAFGFGLLISFLNITVLGINSLIYLLFIFLVQSLSKSRLSGNLFLIVPLTFCLLFTNQLINLTLFHQPLEIFPKIFLESIFSLPILYLIKIWEERFIVQKGIKLKI